MSERLSKEYRLAVYEQIANDLVKGHEVGIRFVKELGSTRGTGHAYWQLSDDGGHYQIELKSEMYLSDEAEVFCHEMGHLIMGHVVPIHYDAKAEYKRQVDNIRTANSYQGERAVQAALKDWEDQNAKYEIEADAAGKVLLRRLRENKQIWW